MAIRYQVRIKPEGGSYGAWIDVEDVTTFQFTNLEPNTTYCIQVRSYCVSGTLSDSSVEYCITTGDAPDEGFPPFFAITTSHDGGNPGRINGLEIVQSPMQRSRLQDGDIAVVQLTSEDEDISIVEDGWENAPNSPVSITSTLRQYTYWKRIIANEPDINFTTTSGIQGGRLCVFRNCIETGDPWLDTSTNTGTGNTVTFPSLDNSEEGSNLVMLLSSTDGTATFPRPYALSNSGVNIQELRKINEGAYTDLVVSAFTGKVNEIGSTGDITCTLHTSPSWVAWAGLLKPATILRPQFVEATINGIYVQAETGGYGSNPSYYPGDYFFALIETNNQPVNISSGSRWAHAPNSPVINAGANPTRLSVLYKKIIGDEDMIASFTQAGNHHVQGSILIRGAAVSGNPFDVTASSNSGSGASISIPGATTTVNNCLIINAIGHNHSETSTNLVGSWTNSDLTSVTEGAERGVTTGTGGGIATSTGIKATAGTYGATTAIHSTGVGMSYNAWTGAIKPEGTSAPTVVQARALTTNQGFFPEVPYPSVAIQRNDILVAFFESTAETELLFPSWGGGWEPLPNLPLTNGTTTLTGYWRRMTGHVLGYDFGGGYDHIHGTILRVRNLRSNCIFDYTNTATGTTSPIAIPGGTATEGNQLVLTAVATTRDATTTFGQFRDWTNSDLTSVIGTSDFINSAGTGGGVGSAVGYKATAGVVGNTTASLVSAGEWAGWTAALRTEDNTEAASFLEVIGNTDPVIDEAINTLVSSLKEADIWDSLDVIYPYVGGTALTHSYNLKDPCRFQITWTGSVLHDENGILSDTVTGYGNTGYNHANNGMAGDEHLSVFSLSDMATFGPHELTIENASQHGTSLLIRTLSGQFATLSQQTNIGISNVNTTHSRGYFSINRTSTTGYRKRGTGTNTNVTGTNNQSLINLNYHIPARNFNGSILNMSNRQIGWTALGRGLTLEKDAELETIVTTFMNTLGRTSVLNLGDSFIGSLDTSKWLATDSADIAITTTGSALRFTADASYSGTSNTASVISVPTVNFNGKIFNILYSTASNRIGTASDGLVEFVIRDVNNANNYVTIRRENNLMTYRLSNNGVFDELANTSNGTTNLEQIIIHDTVNNLWKFYTVNGFTHVLQYTTSTASWNPTAVKIEISATISGTGTQGAVITFNHLYSNSTY
jgi:hypothetical protein